MENTSFLLLISIVNVVAHFSLLFYTTSKLLEILKFIKIEGF